MELKRILVVCTAGTCRSPMAAGLLRQKLQDARLAEFVSVQAAGLFGYEGQQISRHAVELLAARGIDISDDTVKEVDKEELGQADLILVMTEEHRKSIFYRSPHNLHKVLLIGELAGEYVEIKDPIGKDPAVYSATLANIDRLLDKGWGQLMKRITLPSRTSRTSTLTTFPK